MDLKDQLKKLFPDHVPEENSSEENKAKEIRLQDEALYCKYEKRKGKPVTIITNYNGADKDFKILAKELKTILGVGGTAKNDEILIQGDYCNRIMEILKEKGFSVKRVGG